MMILASVQNQQVCFLQVISEGRDAAKEVLIRLVCLCPQIKPPDRCSGRRSSTGLKAGTKNDDLMEGTRGTGQIP